MQRNHAHEDKLHEDMHRGIITLADELTNQEKRKPILRDHRRVSCYTGGFGVRLYFREQGSSHASDDV
jgi:hypothetical protein